MYNSIYIPKLLVYTEVVRLIYITAAGYFLRHSNFHSIVFTGGAMSSLSPDENIVQLDGETDIVDAQHVSNVVQGLLGSLKAQARPVSKKRRVKKVKLLSSCDVTSLDCNPLPVCA